MYSKSLPEREKRGRNAQPLLPKLGSTTNTQSYQIQQQQTASLLSSSSTESDDDDDDDFEDAANVNSRDEQI